MSPLAFIAGLGAPELLIVFLIIVLVFGGAKLPQLARSLGSARREFEAASADADRHLPDEAPPAA